MIEACVEYRYDELRRGYLERLWGAANNIHTTPRFVEHALIQEWIREAYKQFP